METTYKVKEKVVMDPQKLDIETICDSELTSIREVIPNGIEVNLLIEWTVLTKNFYHDFWIIV